MLHALQQLPLGQVLPCLFMLTGLDTLQLAVTYWEDAVMKMGYLDDFPTPAITVSKIYWMFGGRNVLIIFIMIPYNGVFLRAANFY